MKDLIWDIETYINCFSITFLNPKDGKIKVFEMSPWRNDWDEFRKFTHNCSNGFTRWVGFNNYGFDYPVVHFMLRNFKLGKTDGEKLARMAHQKANRIIQAGKDEKFEQMIWDNNQIVPQLDLYKIHHFDNVARATSLKVLEFNMRSETIEDLPYDPAKPLTEAEKNKLIEYNIHDVKETFKFYKKSKDMIDFREVLTKKYDKNFMNHNDTKIGKDYFIMELEKAGVSCYTYGDEGRKPVQTKRPIIRINDVIFPYVRFKRPEFNAVLAWLRKQKIKETKGVLTDIEDFHVLDDYVDINTVKFKKMMKTGRLQSKTAKTYKFPDHLKTTPDKINYLRETYERVTITHLHCVVRGFRFDFGTGGIHGSIEAVVVSESTRNAIIDYDVTSLYPRIGIVNELYPQHLTQRFCVIYNRLFEDRVSHAKGTPENAMLKLALNGVYGDSNNKFSPFYDPQYTMAITINGQLMLCMLAEEMMEVPGVKLIQINTDGVTIEVPRNQVDEIEQINRRWEKLTKLDLERADYKRMFIRDVNNYIGEYTDGKLKRKGAYEYDIGWHQNHSSLCVQKAVEAHLVDGHDIRQFLEHGVDDIHDFMLRQKVPRSSRLMWGGQQMQNVTRYYISEKGQPMVKIMPPTKDQVKKDPDAPERHFKQHKRDNETQWLTTPVNKMPDVLPNKIDYDWYVNEARKLVDPLYEGLLRSMMT